MIALLELVVTCGLTFSLPLPAAFSAVQNCVQPRKNEIARKLRQYANNTPASTGHNKREIKQGTVLDLKKKEIKNTRQKYEKLIGQPYVILYITYPSHLLL